jgi:hypothetical protein
MSSEFHRLVRQVERLERMHRSGVVHLGDVDELFALGRECRAALETTTAPPGLEPPLRPGPVALFKPEIHPDTAAIAQAIGSAVESAVRTGLDRVLQTRPHAAAVGA